MIHAGQAPADDTDALRTALRTHGFDVRAEPPIPTPPAPWRTLDGTVDHGAHADAIGLAVARELRLVADREATPISLQRLHAAADLTTRVREAVGFALINLHLRWDRHTPLLGDWQGAVRRVLLERFQSFTKRRTEIPLLRQGFELLHAVAALRDRPAEPDAIRVAWEEYTAHHSAPLAYGLAFWAEATYRLSEVGLMDAARESLTRMENLGRELAAQLPGLDEDLVAGMWWHHRGRLAYYQGDFPRALDSFAAEWRLLDRLNGASRARLHRNTAGVLTDAGYLDLAEALTRQGLATQALNDEPEHFKTLGRLAEIQLRRGDLAGAAETYQRSWEQQADTQRSGQTLTYRGHVALLAGHPGTAREHYEAAEERDRRQNIHFNPYLCMGQAALALRGGEREELTTMAELYREDFQRLRGIQVLPRAVFHGALFLQDLLAAEDLRAEITLLLDEYYAIEALYLLNLAYPTPESATAPLERITSLLGDWQATVQRFRQRLPRIIPVDTPANGVTPEVLLPVLRECQRDNHWTPLLPLRARIYPMNLLGDGRRT